MESSRYRDDLGNVEPYFDAYVSTGVQPITEQEAMDKYGSITKDSFSDEQNYRQLAHDAVACEARVPRDEKRLQQWESKKILSCRQNGRTDEKEVVEAMRTRFISFKKERSFLTELYMHDSIKALKWVPQDGHPDDVGVFVAKMKRHRGPVVLPTRWVKDNFHRDVVEGIIKHSLTSSFVEVSCDIEIYIDERQVQQLRWVPAGPNLKGEYKNGNYFQGICADRTRHRLDDEFVKSNFSPEFLNLVKAEAMNKNKFFNVPPGAPRTDDSHALMDETFPAIQYRQQSDATCLFCSFASALHFLGVHETAAIIAAAASEFSANAAKGCYNWDALLKIMHESCRWLVPKRIYGSAFDIFEDCDMFPKLVSLEASDGGTQHAITLVGNLIFDANCSRALPLSETALNHCCSTDSRAATYVRVHKGYRFVEQNRSRKRKRLHTFMENNPHSHLVGEYLDD
jgi:hypothetical protein